MIRNYFLIAVRTLWRNKMVTLINLVGMALGFGIFLSLWSWVRFDYSFDKFHQDIESMYLLNVRITMNGSEYTSQRTGGIYAELLKTTFPQVVASCRVSSPQELEFGVKSQSDTAAMKYFNEPEVLAVDSSFLDFFSFRLLEGNPDHIFSERDHLVITKSLADKIFGDRNPMDEMIRIGEGGYFRVVGVIEDPPVESSFQFHALVGFHIMEEMGYNIGGYGGTMFFTNVKVAPGTDLLALNGAINDLVDENFDDELESVLFLDRLTRLHLFGETKGSIGFYLNLIMSLMILSIACINFINLTTAYSSGRVKEIAIRKSAGAGKLQLIIQFMGETYLLLLMAIYLGLFLAEHLVPATARSFGVSMDTDYSDLSFWLQFAGIFLVTGLLAGLYPAVKIAGFKPVTFFPAWSGKSRHRGSRSRKVLIVLQFTFSVAFIIISVFVIRQYAYLKEADLGFNREDVIYIRTSGKAWEHYSLIKSDLEELHFVEGVASGSEIPVLVNRGDIDWGELEGEHNRLARILWADPGFLSTFEIDLLQGEFFSSDRDSLNYKYVVINQSLVDLMGWDDPVGMDFYMWGEELRVLGVTENINFFPFNMKVLGNEALIYLYDPVREYIFVRVSPGITPEQVADIETVFNKYNPGYAFESDFVSEYRFDAQESTEGITFVFKLFSFLAIFIAVMGLIGLSVFNNSRRTKEVGIRKSMGAHTGIIMQLLLSEFLRLVILSNLIAMPIAYFLLHLGFQFFSYSVDLKISVFAVVFLLSLLLSLGVVSYHAFRTARSNPVDSLRYE